MNGPGKRRRQRRVLRAVHHRWWCDSRSRGATRGCELRRGDFLQRARPAVAALLLHVDKPPGELALTMTYPRADDSRRAFPLRRFFVPWAQRGADGCRGRPPHSNSRGWKTGYQRKTSSTARRCHPPHDQRRRQGRARSLELLRFRYQRQRVARHPLLGATRSTPISRLVSQTNNGAGAHQGGQRRERAAGSSSPTPRGRFTKSRAGT